jgi:hypothetical protein
MRGGRRRVDVVDVLQGVHLSRYLTTRMPDGGLVAPGFCRSSQPAAARR